MLFELIMLILPDTSNVKIPRRQVEVTGEGTCTAARIRQCGQSGGERETLGRADTRVQDPVLAARSALRLPIEWPRWAMGVLGR